MRVARRLRLDLSTKTQSVSLLWDMFQHDEALLLRAPLLLSSAGCPSHWSDPELSYRPVGAPLYWREALGSW
ncbi:hypothetical protein PI125_g21474 [Phytophthora idaei]|nr:hypothetical protein PI125_g21474 [Phytophthora idaei]